MDLIGLEQMNEEFPLRENVGDRKYFEARIAPILAMRRANGVVVDRDQFLNNLRAGGDRKSLSIDSLTLLGQDRALVTCVVSTGGKAYQNLRVFVRDKTAPEGWLLLAWANEPI